MCKIKISGLIPTFGDKVCWEATTLKEALLFKWVVQLAIGHAAALKPAVKDIFHPSQLPFASAAWNGKVINLVPVQIFDLQYRRAMSATRSRFILLQEATSEYCAL